MLFIVFFILLILALAGFYIIKDVFSPFVIQPGIWCFILFLYIILPHGFFPLQNQFLLVLLIWNIVFLCFSYLSYYYTQPASQRAVAAIPNKFILDLYFWISLCTMPVVIGLTIWVAYVEDPVNMFRYLRVMNTGIDENIEVPDLGVLYYIVSMNYVLLFFLLIYEKRKWPLFLVFVLNLLYAFVTMSKTVFLSVILPLLYVAYLGKKIKTKHLFYGLVGFIVLSFLLQSVRSAASQENVELVDGTSFISLYLLSSLPAFDYYVVPASSHDFGGHVFRLFYAIMQRFGVDVQPEEVILPFVGVPELTNTYTILYPFYIDYGLWGILIFSMLYGWVYGVLYKKAMTGSKFAQILYAIALCFIVLQFIGEFFFTNLSQELQHIFFVILPFIFTTNRLKWQK